jgi:hypothetical protein
MRKETENGKWKHKKQEDRVKGTRQHCWKTVSKPKKQFQSLGGSPNAKELWRKLHTSHTTSAVQLRCPQTPQELSIKMHLFKFTRGFETWWGELKFFFFNLRNPSGLIRARGSTQLLT